MNIDKMLNAYAACALWSSTGDDCEPLDDTYGVDDIAPDTLAAMREDCADFAAANADDISLTGADAEQVGHDFWLTRNGHGAGFWDRGYGKPGDDLSAAARIYGGVDLYVGDDGKIYA